MIFIYYYISFKINTWMSFFKQKFYWRKNGKNIFGVINLTREIKENKHENKEWGNTLDTIFNVNPLTSIHYWGEFARFFAWCHKNITNNERRNKRKSCATYDGERDIIERKFPRYPAKKWTGLLKKIKLQRLLTLITT